MCDEEMPNMVYQDQGQNVCNTVQGLWTMHNVQRRNYLVQLPRAGHQNCLPSRFYRDNTGTLRVAQGKVAPEAMPLSIQNRIFECPYGEN
jgi:hypothetical protein